IMAVATFYDQFETEEVGTTTLYVCTNISCSLRGADALLHAFEEKTAGRESEFHVRGFECLGACDIAPMISVDGLYIGPIDVDEVQSILDTVTSQGKEAVFPDRQMNNRKSVDPLAGDAPKNASPEGAADVDAEAASEVDDAAAADAEGAAPAGPDPRRHSSATQPSSDPDGDEADASRATGQKEDDQL
ncbi:MAG: NAD(P)H-dependent oxidoreductase subunit E, partial [Solirubrobacteraceae bacterium]